MRKEILSLSSIIRDLRLQNSNKLNVMKSCSLKSSLTNAISSARDGNIDMNTLKGRYSSPLLQPVLPLLACPIENAILPFIAKNGYKFRFNEVLASDETSLFDEIARYVDR